MGRALLLMTEVLHFGTNILGLLLLGAYVALFVGALELSQRVMPAVILAAILFSVAMLSSVDFIWRYGSLPRESKWRFFRPGAGGSLLYLPIWLYLMGGTFAISVGLLAFVIQKRLAAN